MATIKDKIGLAMLPSAQSGGASTDITDFSGTVHSLLPIQHETPDLVDIIPNTTDVNTGGVYTDVTWISDHDFGIGDLLKVTFTLKGLGSTTRAWGYNEFYPKDNVTEYTDGTYTAYWDVISSASITRTFRFYQASSPRTGTISIDRVVKVVNGDFDFERSSSATRVGSDGYIKNVEVLSDELVQNGDFEDVSETEEIANGDFSNSDTSWSTTGLVNAQGGVASFVDNGTNALSQLSQSAGLTTGKIYKLTFDVVRYSAGRIQFSSNGANYDSIDISEGINTYTHYFKALNTSIYFKRDGSYPNYDFDIDNVSVKEVGENWTFGDGWSITDDGGNLKAIASNSPSGSRLSQFNLGQNINKKHRIYYTVSNLSQGGFNIWFGGISGNNITENGTYYQEIIPTQTTQLFFYNVGTTTGQIDNISVVEITDDTDIPRLDFSNAAQPSLLLEPERSNLVATGGNIVYNNVTITQNHGTSPDNKNNSSTLITSTSTSGVFARSSATADVSQSQTFSVFVKTNKHQFVQLLQSSRSSYYVNFDLYNLTVLTKGSDSLNPKIEAYPNNWARISVTWDNSQSYLLTNNTSRLYPVNETAAYGGGGAPIGSEVEFWGMQVEMGNYPTSYIPVSIDALSTTVTRSADVCNNAGDSTIFNDAEGVLFAEFSREDVTTNGHIGVNDGTADNGVVIKVDTTANQLTGWVRRDATFSMVRSFSVPEGFNKIAVKYKENDHSIFINGELVWSDTGGQSPSGLKTLSFSRFGTDSLFTGNCRQLLYFNEALSDAELERLTSSDITQVLRNYNRRGELLGATYESTHVQTKLNELF